MKLTKFSLEQHSSSSSSAEDNLLYVQMFLASADFQVFADMMRGRWRARAAKEDSGVGGRGGRRGGWSWADDASSISFGGIDVLSFKDDAGTATAGTTFAWDTSSTVAGGGK